jgi:hypothetical protein
MKIVQQYANARHFWHQSGVNQKGEPFVQLILDGVVIAQMDPEDARDHARAITEAAEAAEQDAFLVTWVKEKVGAGPAEAAVMLQEFRAFRLARTGKKAGALHPDDWVMPPGKERPDKEP